MRHEFHDGKKKLRFVGFDEKLQMKLSTLNEEGTAVKLQSCHIKQGFRDTLGVPKKIRLSQHRHLET